MFLLFLLLCSVSSYKILVFSPTISRSHMISNGRIADTLAKGGHDVVLFEPDFMSIVDSVQSAKLARRWPVRGFSEELLQVILGLSSDLFEDATLLGRNRDNLAYEGAFDSLCKQLVENDTLMRELREENFDAFFGEHINLCGHGIAYALGIKIHFWVSSCPVFESVSMFTGMPYPLSYIPAEWSSLPLEPSYLQRAWNVFNGANAFLLGYYFHWRTTRVFRDKFGEDFPFLGEIAGNSDIVFVATDEFVDMPRPVVPNMVNIGGLAGDENEKQLDQKFESEMERGKNGVVYFSLGTVVNTTLIDRSVLQNLAMVAKAFPDYHFIVRVDSQDFHARRIAEDVPNLSLFDWLPQPALLNHPRMRLFITHGGYNGIMEAGRAAVPLLIIPFLWDQPKNSLAVARNGWGLHLDRKILRDDPKILIKTTRKLLLEKKFKKAAVRVQRLIRTKPFNASERLVKTTEFVLANGGLKELLVEGRRIPFLQHNNLDILIPLLFVVCLLARSFVVLIARVTCFKVKREKRKAE